MVDPDLKKETYVNQFIPRPYKLYNKIQNYDWGTKDEDAFIPKFLGIQAQAGILYAELWIGAHPKAPSEIEIDGERIALNKVIEKHGEEILGEYVSKKFGGKFPFLLKVLSAARSLSIQLHPDKLQAEKLHAYDSQNYPDANHKPEIAIAIDGLTAIAGFKPVEKIINTVKQLPELRLLTGEAPVENLLNAGSQNGKEDAIKELYETIMKLSSEKEKPGYRTGKLALCISKICERLKLQSALTEEESQFLIQHKLYGNDVGLLSFFFFNMIHLESNRAIFTGAGTPHAYIKGNIIECMANSDNVVRAGLTGKFKDVETLLDIVNYEFKEYSIINEKGLEDEIIYKTPAEEFVVSAFRKNAGYKKGFSLNDRPSICLVQYGEIEIYWGKESQRFGKGESFLVPASLSEHSFAVIHDSKFFIVEIPR